MYMYVYTYIYINTHTIYYLIALDFMLKENIYILLVNLRLLLTFHI